MDFNDIRKKALMLRDVLAKAAPALPPKPAIHASAPLAASVGSIPPGLAAIMDNESSGGKNLNHQTVTTGLNAGARAGGAFAVMPITFREVTKHDPKLNAKYGHVAAGTDDEVSNAMNADKDMSQAVAVSHYNHLMTAFKGDHIRAAHAWLNGIHGTENKSDSEVLSNPYVQKYMTNYAKHAVRKPFVAPPDVDLKPMVTKSEDEDFDLIKAARVTPERITQLLASDKVADRVRGASHKLATSEHLDTALNDMTTHGSYHPGSYRSREPLVENAVAKRTDLKPHHIDKLIAHQYGAARQTLLENHAVKLSPDHMNTLMDRVEARKSKAGLVAKRPEFTDAHYDRAIATGKAGAALNSYEGAHAVENLAQFTTHHANAKPEQLHDIVTHFKGINQYDSATQAVKAAIGHPNVAKHSIEHVAHAGGNAATQAVASPKFDSDSLHSLIDKNLPTADPEGNESHYTPALGALTHHALLTNPNVNGSHFDKLIDHGNKLAYADHESLAGNSKMTTHNLDRLTDHHLQEIDKKLSQENRPSIFQHADHLQKILNRGNASYSYRNKDTEVSTGALDKIFAHKAFNGDTSGSRPGQAHLEDHSDVIRSALNGHNSIDVTHLNAAFKNSKNPRVRGHAVSHKKADHDLISRGIEDQNLSVRAFALGNEKVTPDHINQAAHSKYADVRIAAMSHKSAPKELLDEGMASGRQHEQLAVLNNVNHTAEHAAIGMKSDDDYVRRRSLESKQATPEGIEAAYYHHVKNQDTAGSNQMLQFSGSKVSPGMLSHAAEHGNGAALHHISGHPSATTSDLDHVMRRIASPESGIDSYSRRDSLYRAVKNPNLGAHHVSSLLDTAANETNLDEREAKLTRATSAVANSRNATPEHVDKLLQIGQHSSEARKASLSSKGARPHHVDAFIAHPNFSIHDPKDVRRVLEAPQTDESHMKTMKAKFDATSEANRTYHEGINNSLNDALRLHQPDAYNEGSGVNFKHGTEHLREMRARVDEHGGKVERGNLPGIGIDPNRAQQHSVKEQQPKGPAKEFLTNKKLSEAIDKAPSDKFNIAHSEWDGMQRHSNDTQKVTRLNLTNDHVKRMKEAGVFGTFQHRKAEVYSNSHPVTPDTVGWVRHTGDADQGHHIDEIQTDWGRHFDKIARDKSGDPEQREHAKKINHIVFGGRHPETVLHDAFRQHLRDTGSVGSQVHINSAELKAKINGLRTHQAGGEEKDIPVHYQETYNKAPKSMMMETKDYGSIKPQSGERYKGSPSLGTTGGAVAEGTPAEKVHATTLKKSEGPPMLYVSCDGDSVGAQVGVAAQHNDLEGIKHIDAAIKAGQKLLVDFAKKHGGEVYIRGGDDVCFMLPDAGKPNELMEPDVN